MEYGLILAIGQLGWEATPAEAAKFWSKLRHHMATCDLNLVDADGASALCRFMYTQHGFAIPAMYDGGPIGPYSVHYRETASASWDGLKQRQVGARSGRQKAARGWPSSVTATEIRYI